MAIKKPWERRLKDLSILLENCSTTYFDPDLFRMNTNQFLQTSRTITFIIQKNKKNIPDFDLWYKNNVLDNWKKDEVMTWAKDSRNKIEKEGDLDINSTLNTKLIFSYLKENDIKIECGKKELLGYGVKKLIRLAQKKLPSGVSDASVIKVERKWIVSSLPSWELLHALNYVYARIYECCQSLGKYLDNPVNTNIPAISCIDTSRELAIRSEYIKLRGLKSHQIISENISIDHDFKPPEAFKKIFKEQEKNSENFDSAINLYKKMAESTFNTFGNHIPMLFMLNKKQQVINMLSPKLDDQADKFMFWRMIGERIATQQVHTLIWISELWKRQVHEKNSQTIAIRNMPIVGEQLSIWGVNQNNERKRFSWDIIRSPKKKPELVISLEEVDSNTPFFFVPALRAMGLSDEKVFIHGK